MVGSCLPSKHTRITDHGRGWTDRSCGDWIELELPKFTNGAEAFLAAQRAVQGAPDGRARARTHAPGRRDRGRRIISGKMAQVVHFRSGPGITASN